MYKIPSEVLQAIANYLGNRPYIEAKPFIDALSGLEKIEEKTELKEVPEELSEVG